MPKGQLSRVQGFIQNPGKRGISPPLTSFPPLTKSVLVCRRPQITLRGLKNHSQRISKFFWGSMPPDHPRSLWPMAAADQLSRTQMFPSLEKNPVWNPGVPWPGNSSMPFTFQPALQALQQPHKHSRSLQQATDTELAHQWHHYIKNAFSVAPILYQLSVYQLYRPKILVSAIGNIAKCILVTKILHFLGKIGHKIVNLCTER